MKWKYTVKNHCIKSRFVLRKKSSKSIRLSCIFWTYIACASSSYHICLPCTTSFVRILLLHQWMKSLIVRVMTLSMNQSEFSLCERNLHVEANYRCPSYWVREKVWGLVLFFKKISLSKLTIVFTAEISSRLRRKMHVIVNKPGSDFYEIACSNWSSERWESFTAAKAASGFVTWQGYLFWNFLSVRSQKKCDWYHPWTVFSA